MRGVRALLWGLLACALSWAGAGLCADAAPAGDSARSEELVLGRISDDPRRHYDRLRPLLDYVVARMGDVGIRRGRILMARDSQQMASYVRRGRVDWLTESTGIALDYQRRANARVLLSTVRDDVAHYRTVFFTRRDGPVRSLDDLRGRSIAFQNPNSTSAYFAPAADLLDAGLSLELLLSPRDRPAPGSVGYVFARTESNISTWVHKRLVDVGVFSDRDWNNLQRLPQAYRDDLVVFHETRDFPRALEIVRGDLPVAVRERLRTVLLEAGDDPAAREALRAFFGTRRFLEIDDEARAGMDALDRGVRRVRAELE